MPPKRISDGEKILCYHGPMMYEAKCIRGQVKDKSMQYFVHYNGWNKSWDEWVPEGRVMKHNDTNLQKQKELQQQSKSSKKRRGGPDRSAMGDKHDKMKKGEVVETSRKRRRGEMAAEDDSSTRAARNVSIVVPENLRKWLVDDADLINKQKQLVTLPHRHSVVTILADFRKTVALDVREHSIATEVSLGLTEYFNVLLGTQLLYKFERAQYAELLSDNSDQSVSELYGAEHLLRLFVRLGSVLSFTSMDDPSTNLLLRHIHAVLKFVSENSSTYLCADNYYSPAPEYHRKLA